MNWKYSQPVSIYFGNGALGELSQRIAERGYQRGVLITTTHFLKNGTAKKLLSNSENHLINSFTGFSQNPDVSEVDGCAQLLRKEKADFIVALGGGSVMDGAKAASAMALTGNSIKTYYGSQIPVPEEHLPVIAVPTTAGTGSEVTSVAVLTNREKGTKAPMSSNSFYPECAVIDPRLTWSMSPYLTACTGIDVLSHAIEGYWSKGHQPICDALAIHAAKLVFENLRVAYKDGTNVTAREKMSEASVIAGLAFGLPKTTSSHACSFPLTNLYGIPHGEACGLTLDFFIQINGKKDVRTQELSKILGFKNSEEMAMEVKNLKKELGLRMDLKDKNLTKKEKNQLIALSHYPNLCNNPVEITDRVLRKLYDYLCGEWQ
ncbi:methanol dehydrogenase [Anaerostipes sp. 494a]|uniref:iron-containing alcohol dehydrogenase family protein n=1 Tax=Anaerostipes sp. 494a TaxID=1261636 RepID=UPI000952866E|nr:iron-containing alcohol dehydrogenase family protein [Anaerostipes sp. 494a]OLR59997.1 methanol dehydrogenase [Anaerostipes sp. 494a]